MVKRWELGDRWFESSTTFVVGAEVTAPIAKIVGSNPTLAPFSFFLPPILAPAMPYISSQRVLSIYFKANGQVAKSC